MYKTIEEYSLAAFVQKVQTEIQNGWEIDFDDNDSIPVGWIGFYRCKVKKSGQIPALFLPKTDESGQPPPVQINLSEPPEQVVQLYVPSFVFEVQTEPAASTSKKAGRPRAVTI